MLPDDVRRLVIAARMVAYDTPPSDDALRELDRAAEAFATRVPWENEPMPGPPDLRIVSDTSPQGPQEGEK